TNAAREGAAYGSTHPFIPGGANQAGWQQGVEDAVAGELTSVLDYDPNKLTVSYSNPIITSVNGDRRIQITVGYPFETITTWLPTPQSRTLHRTVEMRLIR
ncbi:MAG: hypothetical protein GTO26_04805, partial [Planctomycetales bacterium]|nr:hypothetical protein [Planctomycetales bacterium]NIO46100.1 hypothetical protein [Planctomycetales bacterium]